MTAHSVRCVRAAGMLGREDGAVGACPVAGTAGLLARVRGRTGERGAPPCAVAAMVDAYREGYAAAAACRDRVRAGRILDAAEVGLRRRVF